VFAILDSDHSKAHVLQELRVIARQQQMVRVDFETSPDQEVLAAHLDEFTALAPTYDAIIMSDYGKGGLTHIERMIAIAKAADRPILVDPKGDDYARYRGATLLTPNRAELREVVGRWKNEADLEARAHKLRKDLELQALLLTRSEEGMTLFTDEGAWSVPAQAREVFDVSGAGDTVIAVLGTMLAAGRPLRDAVALANKAGGIVVGKLGTATVSYEELFGA
jgi:rfaE bifunctional protein kinase chain/domain